MMFHYQAPNTRLLATVMISCILLHCQGLKLMSMRCAGVQGADGQERGGWL